MLTAGKFRVVGCALGRSQCKSNILSSHVFTAVCIDKIQIVLNSNCSNSFVLFITNNFLFSVAHLSVCFLNLKICTYSENLGES